LKNTSAEREHIDFINAVFHRIQMDSDNKVRNAERYSIIEPFEVEPEAEESTED
jgi:hypothetical protein